MNLINKKQHALRFSDIPETNQEKMSPIKGYENFPLVTLEEAVNPLIPIVHDVQRMVWIVKQNCKNPADDLSPDESASIMLYSMAWEPQENAFYMILNNVLRADDRALLKPWFLYLKLFITALSKIPSKRRFLHRGVKMDISADYPTGKVFVWWPFTSCTSSIKVLENEDFLGKKGTRTLFTIECHTGKDIRQHSMFKSEDEVLLLAARQFEVVSQMDSGNGLHIIQIKEIDPVSPLLETVPTGDTLASAKNSLTFSSMKIVSPQMIGHKSTPYHNEKLEQTLGKCQPRKIDLKGEVLNDQDIDIVIKQGLVDKQCIKLNLMNIEVTQHGISKLADALRNNAFLEEIDISHASILDSGVRLLASAINSSILKRIDLNVNEISDVGAQYLAEMLETNMTLLRLSLSGNQIDDHGVNMLATALSHGNKHLEVLDLSANEDVSDGSIDSLAGMMEHNRSLKKLDLRHCSLSDDGEARLRVVASSKRGFDLWLSHFK